MIFRLEIEVTPTEYRATSAGSDFSISGPAVCMTVTVNDKPMFVSIAEGEGAFEGDPDFERMAASGEVRVFNPLDIQSFEPEDAATVIWYFRDRAHHHLRRRYPSLIREFYEMFVDRFVLTIYFPGFDSLREETQCEFRRALRRAHAIKRLEILSI